MPRHATRRWRKKKALQDQQLHRDPCREEQACQVAGGKAALGAAADECRGGQLRDGDADQQGHPRQRPIP